MATYKVHITRSSSANVFRIGLFEERADRTEGDRIDELNRKTSVVSAITHQHAPYAPHLVGSNVYSSKTDATVGREALKSALKAVGASFADDNVFILINKSPASALAAATF